MYREWQKDSSAVHKSWDVYFRNVAAGAPAGQAYAAPPTLGAADYAGAHQAAPPVPIQGGLQAGSSTDPGTAQAALSEVETLCRSIDPRHSGMHEPY